MTHMLYDLTFLLARHEADWDHGPGWVFGPVILLFWIVVIVGVVWFIWRHGGRHERTGVERARGVLAERFARGEISGEEYRERLEQLR